MKYIAPLIIFILFFSACAENKNEKLTETELEKSKMDSVKIAQNVTMNGCFRMIIATDTANMKVSQMQDSITGTLTYKRKEKDSNKGEVHLFKKNDRAEGWYTFQSEGKISVRQIVFKITANSFAEAYGDIKMNNDTAVFKYPHALNYEEKHPFNKVNCD